MTDRQKVTTALSILNDPSLSYAKKRRRGREALAPDPPTPPPAPEVLYQSEPGVKPFDYLNPGESTTRTYYEAQTWDGHIVLRCWHDGNGDGISRGWVNLPGGIASVGDTYFQGDEFGILEPEKHLWTGLQRLTHWDGEFVYSQFAVILSRGELTLWIQDYPSSPGSFNLQLTDPVPCPQGRFHMEFGGLIHPTLGHAELWINEQKMAEADGPTITQDFRYMMSQHGMGTVQTTGPTWLRVAKPTLARGRLGAI